MSLCVMYPDLPLTSTPSRLADAYDNGLTISIVALYASVLWSSILLHGVAEAAGAASRLAVRVARSVALS